MPQMNKKKILIFGCNGYIGKSLCDGLSFQYDVTATSRKNFDMTDYRGMSEWLADKYFDVAINAAVVGGSRLKTDDMMVLDKNLQMHYNIVANKDRFDRFISFGSGAEIFSPDTPYGMSKKIISNSIRTASQWYNIRVFAVFDENELDSRFIKANINRSLRGESMKIHSNKTMDFFYMKDLISLVKHYIDSDNPNKEINCSYPEKFTLLDIANKINGIAENEVSIEIDDSSSSDYYCGHEECMPIELIGLDAGIEETYKKLRERHTCHK